MTYYFLVEVLIGLYILKNLLSVNSRGIGTSLVLDVLNLALLMLLLIGPLLWGMIRNDLPFGLLGFLTLDGDQLFLLQAAILPVVLGIFSSSLLVKLVNMTRGKESRLQAPVFTGVDFDHRFSLKVFWIGIVQSILFLIGQGSSIFFRSVYLRSNGLLFLDKLTLATVIPVLFLLSYFFSKSVDRGLRYAFGSLLFVNYVELLAVGSRTAVLLVIFASIFIVSTKRRVVHKFWLGVVSIAFSGLTFDVTQISRSTTHGILMIPKNLFLALSGNSLPLLSVMKEGLGSLLSMVVVIPRSTASTSTSLLVSDLNPIFGSSVDQFSFNSNGIERLWPYRWVPLSTAGQVYGVGGAWLVFGIFFTLSTLYLLALGKLPNSTSGKAVMILIQAAFIAQLLFYLQYPARIWIRATEFFVLIALLSIGIKMKPQTKKGETHV